MKHFPIGIMLECLRLDFYQSLDRAVELGADGFQLCFFGPDPMPRNEFLQKRAAIESHHLTVSAVCGELGWFTDPVGNVEKIKRMETIFNFAYDLGVHVVTGHIGPVPEDKDDPVYRAAPMRSTICLSPSATPTFWRRATRHCSGSRLCASTPKAAPPPTRRRAYS